MTPSPVRVPSPLLSVRAAPHARAPLLLDSPTPSQPQAMGERAGVRGSKKGQPVVLTGRFSWGSIVVGINDGRKTAVVSWPTPCYSISQPRTPRIWEEVARCRFAASARRASSPSPAWS